MVSRQHFEHVSLTHISLVLQRLKGFNLDSFLDSKIAEEEARQGKRTTDGAGPAKRSSSTRRSGGRTDSPARRAGSRLRALPGEDGRGGKAPDPEEFVIGEDSLEPSRSGTPRPAKDGGEPVAVAVGDDKEQSEKQQQDDVAATQDKGKGKVGGGEDEQLPEDVRKKLARLEALTAKYQGMLSAKPLHCDWHLLFYSQNFLCVDLLRNYRAAHARVSQIEPFEATLREHTPLANITDPGALVEFLNQRSLQSEMVMEELKRISGEHRDVVKERDELKGKLSEAEEKTRQAVDEAAVLRKEQAEKETTKVEANGSVVPARESTDTTKGDPLGVEAGEQSAVTKSAPETKKDEVAKSEEDGEAFFSYDSDLESQIKKHEEDIKQQREYINELETENASMRQDLDIVRLDLDAARNKLTIRDRELSSVQTDLGNTKAQLEAAAKAREEAKEEEERAADLLVQTEGHVVHLQGRLEQYKDSLNQTNKELQDKAATAEENLKKYQMEHEENVKNGKYVKREEQRLKTYENVVIQLREQVKATEESKRETANRVNDLQFEIKRLEAEVSSSGDIISKLRDQETRADALAKKLTLAEHERDDAQRFAESKKGHEAAVASLRSQLKRAEKDRDSAYQMILDCGKCEKSADDKQDKSGLETPDASTIGSPRPLSRLGSESTEVSSLPTEITSLSVDGGDHNGSPADLKKKKKKKSGGKKKKDGVADVSSPVSTPSIEEPKEPLPSIAELIANPSKANKILKNGDNSALITALISSMQNMKEQREADDDGREGVIRHHEQVIEEQAQKLKDQVLIVRDREEEIEKLGREIRQKEEAIDRLDSKLRDQEGLLEELDDLRYQMAEMGNEHTGHLHRAKMASEEKERLQEELDELQVENDNMRKSLRDAEAQRDELSRRCSALEAEVAELNTTQSSSSTASIEELQAVNEKLEAVLKEKATSTLR